MAYLARQVSITGQPCGAFLTAGTHAL